MTVQDLLYQLDEERLARQMTIQRFVEGIVSPRSYRRYLSGDTDMPVSVFHQLTQRLHMTMQNLIARSQRKIILNHMDEKELYDTIIRSEYQTAYDLYQARNGRPFVSYVKHELNAMMIMVEQELGLISFAEASKRINQTLAIDHLLEQTVVDHQEILPLMVLVNFISIENHQRLVPFLEDLLEGRRTLLTDNRYRSNMFLVTTYYKCLTFALDDDPQRLEKPTLEALQRLTNTGWGHFSYNLIKMVYEFEDGFADSPVLQSLVQELFLPSFMLHDGGKSIWQILDHDRTEESMIDGLDDVVSLFDWVEVDR